MILSALCIVKNEANNLPRWLDGMKQVADEIIVTDISPWIAVSGENP